MSPREPIGFTPPPINERDRAIMREVALTYRRDRRLGASEHVARSAADRRYLELRPKAAVDLLAASGNVARLIANFVAADTRWFWHGPDA